MPISSSSPGDAQARQVEARGDARRQDERQPRRARSRRGARTPPPPACPRGRRSRRSRAGPGGDPAARMPGPAPRPRRSRQPPGRPGTAASSDASRWRTNEASSASHVSARYQATGAPEVVAKRASERRLAGAGGRDDERQALAEGRAESGLEALARQRLGHGDAHLRGHDQRPQWRARSGLDLVRLGRSPPETVSTVSQ